ncbi:MAG: transcriptional repressor LexA [Bdellovibrionales bacterium]|nr:transcriptional repressor LexA [Bdellovibrionales bacterium]
MLQPLTRKEKMVLEYIEGYLHNEGVAPSFQEIKDHFGFASFNSVQRYLKQLQKKNYIHVPGGNQKRAINILRSANSLQNHLQNLKNKSHSPFVGSSPKKGASVYPTHTQGFSLTNEDEIASSSFNGKRPESLSLPLLGGVAAGLPLEAIEHDEFIDVPSSLVNNFSKTFALKVEGESMIEDGILDGDIILVEQKARADNGELIVASVENEATVKRFFVHLNEDHKALVELRPANSTMQSMWFSPKDVHIRGKVVGLIRKF